jgi:regulator of protease activity HflC (stomatin/prohibitin superfamily)
MAIATLIVSILVILAGFALVVKGRVRDEVNKRELRVRGAGVVVLLVGLGLMFINSFTVVGAKNVAVEHSFGKPGRTLTNGWNWVAPWASTEHFDASLQPLKLSGGGDDNGDPITVQMNNRTITAQVEVLVEWQLDDTKDITPLWKEYRTFEKISENVVRRRLSSALNTLFDKFDPLAALKGDGTTVALSDLERDAKAAVQALMPDGIQIRSLYLPKFIYPEQVQAQLNQYIAAVNDTKIAQQQKATATARREANEELTKNGSALTPGLLYQNCLDLVERLAKDGKPLPPAFNCGTPPTPVLPVR